MDAIGLFALSGLSPAGGRGRRIQRQVHGEPAGAARLVLRHAARPQPSDLSQLLLSLAALAVYGPASRGGRMTVDTDREDFARAVTEGLSGARKSLPCRYFYDARGSE